MFVYVPSIVISPGTLAAEPVDPVDALAPVGAGVREALVDIGLAVLSREARYAFTCIPDYNYNEFYYYFKYIAFKNINIQCIV